MELSIKFGNSIDETSLRPTRESSSVCPLPLRAHTTDSFLPSSPINEINQLEFHQPNTSIIGGSEMMTIQRVMSTATTAAHVLVIPFPTSGHIIPLLDFARHLAVNGLFLTVVVTPDNLVLLEPLVSAHPNSIEALAVALPETPPNSETKHYSSSPRDLIFRLGGLHAPLKKWFSGHPSPPSAIISDMFLGWTNRLAIELGIKRIVFSPSGAMSSCVVSSLWRELILSNPNNSPGEDEDDVITFPNIPNSPKYPWWQISGTYRAHVQGDPVSEFIKYGFLANMDSWGLVVNTFDDLEQTYLHHLRKELGHDRVWAVGPVLPPEIGIERGGRFSVLAQEIVSWLDMQENDSVVYVCFGSLAKLNTTQMDQLGLGLEKSGAHFIWVVGKDSQVPLGFEDRVLNRGVVIRGWAPQLPILTHRAVGSFLTHCGWNSVLEGVVAGVPMLAWPMKADQFVDATLIVDELRVGKRVCEGANAVPNPEELARAIAESVDQNSPERGQAMGLRASALQAIQEGGRSTKDLAHFIKHLNALPL